MVNSEVATNKTSDIFKAMSSGEHELVMFCQDEDAGLKAIIAVHSTALGPGVGGVRMWNYASEQEAVMDVLRLSRGMTYKNALAGLDFGGGKAVIMGESRNGKSEAMLRRFGRFVNNLGGKYFTAEDVGMTEGDMEIVKAETPYVTGISEMLGGSGDPSVVTAYGTYIGIKAALKHQTGKESLAGKRVTVQGVGAVGKYLVTHLKNEGAEVFIHDLYADRETEIAKELGVTPLKSDEVYSHPVDVFSPCALGAILNKQNITQLNCGIVAGAANNQLLDEDEDAERLINRGILYAPDFAINSGGIINISVEFEEKGYQRERAMVKAERIYDTLLKIFKLADSRDISTHSAAVWMAEERIERLSNIYRYI